MGDDWELDFDDLEDEEWEWEDEDWEDEGYEGGSWSEKANSKGYPDDDGPPDWDDWF